MRVVAAPKIDALRGVSRYRLAAAFGIVAASVLPVLSGKWEPALVRKLGYALETRISGADLSATQIDGIIVLGGSPTRVKAALDVAQKFPEAVVVLSGPGEAEIRLATAALGRSDRFVVDRRPTNTYENGLYSRSLLAPTPGQRWLLVTSAVHMPRSLGVFQSLGFPVLPWPVYDMQASAAVASDRVWHEIIGLVGYRMLGRTGNFYPRHDSAEPAIAQHHSEPLQPIPRPL
jgi:uncharacterized SAM-binding protein YcdF (DUF218 family)